VKEIEKFRQSIKNGEKLIGSNVSLNDISSTELITSFMDFVWLDMEHGGINIKTVEGHIMMAKKNGKVALVRVPRLGEDWIKMVLDSGAHGLIVPQIKSHAEVRDVVEITRYYPEGKRGFGPRVPLGYGNIGNIRDYLEWANKNIYIAIQIETKEAYRDLDKILAIKGFDAICIGPADFSLSMGYFADISCSAFVEILEDVIRRAKSAKKDVGFGTGADLDYCKKIIKLGVDWLQVGEDFNYIKTMCEKICKIMKDIR